MPALLKGLSPADSDLIHPDIDLKACRTVITRGCHDLNVICHEPTVPDEIHAVQIGPILAEDPILSAYDSPGNFIRGMNYRVARDNPNNYDKSNILAEFSQFVQDFVKRYEPLPEILPSHELLDSEWLNGSHYTLKQKEKFHAELDKYLDGKRSRFNWCKAFVKKEFYEAVKEPRVINSRSDMFKSVVAPYVKLIEDRVYDEHFIKHKERSEVLERMLNISRRFTQVMETDYSSFEGSFTPRFLQSCEAHLFKHMLMNNPDILRVVSQSWLKTNVIHGKHARCYIRGKRMSGEMWTSLGNGFTNMMLTEFMFYHFQKTTHQVAEFDYIVEGDDGFIGCSIVPDTSVVEDLGFMLKLNVGTKVNDLSFCGMNIGPQGLYPDFWRQIRKFGWCHDSSIVRAYRTGMVTPKVLKRCKMLLRAKAYSLLLSSPPMPILTELSFKMIQLTAGYHVSQQLLRKMLAWRDMDTTKVSFDLSSFDRVITSQARSYFAKRFGIPEHIQVEIENNIAKLTDPLVIMDF